MGLDSVELLIEWENYFKIEIPDIVAEKINTVQSAVDSISEILTISRENHVLKEQIFSQLQEAVSKFNSKNVSLEPTDLVCKTFPENEKIAWEFISKELKLNVPFPPHKPEKSTKIKIFKILSWVPNFNYNELTFSQLTDVICGTNYEKLINPNAISTKYEIYCALMGITVEKIGIDVYEFSHDKTFTGDFGID